MLEIWSTVVTTGSVMVALALGVYGIRRDRRAEAAVARQQALQIVFTADLGETGKHLTVRNMSQAVITDVDVNYVTIGSQEADAGEEIEVSTGADFVLPGVSFQAEINWQEARLSDDRLSMAFTDANGVRWMRPLGEPLARK